MPTLGGLGMNPSSTQLQQISPTRRMRFPRPIGCSVSACSALALYEDELARHQQTEARLRESVLREQALRRQKDELILHQDTLRKEAEHRLLNQVQLIGSLLSLQGRATKNAEVTARLIAAADRVATLGRVHRHLHTLEETNSVEFKQFLKTLCNDLAQVMGSEDPERSVVVEGSELRIPTVTAIPLGYIACELITNSIKYSTGRIIVSLQETPAGCVLSVSDCGPGLPSGFSSAATKGLGMKLIAALVKQIGGALDIGKGDGGQGSKFTVRFAPQGSLLPPPRG